MKNVLLPSFEKNVDYKEYNPQEKTGKYRYITLKPITVCVRHRTLLPKNFKLQFNDSKGIKRMVITSYSITVFEGYAWDGCTPKRNIFNHWVGTPDFPETILASLIHDALRQFESTEHFPFSRELQDQIFYYILRANGFRLSWIYLAGVNLGSCLFKKRSSVGLTSLKIFILD